MIKALIGGLIGGIIGAAIWAAIVYFTNYEVGLVAILVGFLVGGGVRWGAAHIDGWTPGILASAIAIGSIVAAKYAIVSIVVAQAFSTPPASSQSPAQAEELAISYIADEIARARERAGTPVDWPAGVEEGTAYYMTDYPTDIWSQALQQWGGTDQTYKDAALTRPELASREHRIALMGHLVVEQGQGGYSAYTWPVGADLREDALYIDEFPTDLWTAAESRLDATDDAGHQQFAQWASHRLTERQSTAVAAATQAITQFGFASSFTPWDALWFFLAVGSAFKLGSGMASND